MLALGFEFSFAGGSRLVTRSHNAFDAFIQNSVGTKYVFSA
jgi:hypothetical protein